MTNNDTLRIRRATVADARAIAEISVRSWQTAYRGIMPDEFLAGMSIDAREVALASRLESDEADKAPAWVADLGGAPIGFVSSGPPRDEDVPLPAAEIYAIYVLPSAWRRGAGRALMTAALDEWQVRGVTTLVLWVLEANSKARSFYEAMGWTPDGRSQHSDFGAFERPEVRYRCEAKTPVR